MNKLWWNEDIRDARKKRKRLKKRRYESEEAEGEYQCMDKVHEEMRKCSVKGMPFKP